MTKKKKYTFSWDDVQHYEITLTEKELHKLVASSSLPRLTSITTENIQIKETKE